MNYIVLEGLSLYLVIVLMILLLIVSLGCLMCLIILDRKNFYLEELILRKDRKIKKLIQDNFILRIKCGELDIDER